MERSMWFYVLLGAAVVIVPALADRWLKDRVAAGWRFAIGTLAAAATGVLLAVIARPLGL